MKPIQQVAEITVSYKPEVRKNPLIESSIDAYREVKSFSLRN